MKLGCIQKEPNAVSTLFRKGDYVVSSDLGDGIVVGFSSITGEPHVFFYLQQEVLCVGSETLKRC